MSLSAQAPQGGPPPFTYELQIQFPGDQALLLKEQVTAWLTSQGVDSFVEGVITDLDLDHEEPEANTDYYEDLGGAAAPLSVYSYDREFLHELEARLRSQFGDILPCQQLRLDTQSWLEGWKDSFKPIKTQTFYIYPSWEAPPSPAIGLTPLVIDPGLAFGTGQHATTQLCLSALEMLAPRLKPLEGKKLLDLGTGSGILAIAAMKLGFPYVHACDVDTDAIIASRRNAQANGFSLHLWHGSLPVPSTFCTGEGPQTYDLIMANILLGVLERLLPELSLALAPQGHLILSGILSSQVPQMLAACEQEGLKLEQSLEHAGWSCLRVSKP